MTVDTEDLAETAVRNYLLFLQDPAQLVDTQRLADLKQRAAEAHDPIDRLMALSELERASQPDAESLQRAFVLHARRWAAEHQVGVSAFRELGVDDDVLRSAGMLGKGKTAAGRPRQPAGASAVHTSDIRRYILNHSGTFTFSDLAQHAGGSPMTIRKAVYDMVAEGTVRELGRDANWSSRGRAPLVFERTS